jgi:NitT/TauT family transport system permease protein
VSKTAELTAAKQSLLVEARPGKSFINRYLYSDFSYNCLSLSVFVALWSLLAAVAQSPFVPAPLQVWDAFVQLYRVGDVEGYTLRAHVSMSIIRILSGFTLAAVMGIPLGLLMGLNPKIYDRTRSIIEPIRFIPPIAWIPLSIVILMGFSRYVFLIWLGAFFPIWINTLVSVPRSTPFTSMSAAFLAATDGCGSGK